MGTTASAERCPSATAMITSPASERAVRCVSTITWARPIRLDLGELIVTRTFAAGKEGEEKATTSLTVESTDGAVFRSPQKVLDDLLGALSFDPLAFARADAEEQLDTLRSFVPGVDFKAIDQANQADYDRRRDINRRAKELRAQAEGIQLPAEIGALRGREREAQVHGAAGGREGLALEVGAHAEGLAVGDRDGRDVARADVAHDLAIDPPTRLLDPPFAARSFDNIVRLPGSRLRIEIDGVVMPIDWSRVEVVGERQSLRLHLRLPRSGALASMRVSGALFPYDPNHRTFLNVYEGEALTQAILDGGETLASLEAKVASGEVNPRPVSGRQEELENRVNRVIWTVDR